MMTIGGMDALARLLQKQGVPEEKAYHYASLIGDTPLLDDDGKLVITERDGTVLDIIEMPRSFFGGTPRRTRPKKKK